jgi:hypothetical protein
MKKFRAPRGIQSPRADVPLLGREPDQNKPLESVMEGAKALGRRVVIENVGKKVTASGLVLVGNVHQDLAWQVVSVGAKVEEALGYPLRAGDYVVPENRSDMPVGKRLFAFCDCASLLCVLPEHETAKLVKDRPMLVVAPNAS